MSAVARFLGDTPLRVALKLIVVSFLVGIVMSAFGWSPFDVVDGIRQFFLDIWNMGFAAIDRFFGYFLLGAAIVVPAFIVLRIFSYRRWLSGELGRRLEQDRVTRRQFGEVGGIAAADHAAQRNAALAEEADHRSSRASARRC